jgi:hypothetical protein
MTGRLSPAAVQRIEEHLETCPLCAERVGQAKSDLTSRTERITASETVSAQPADATQPGGTIKYGSDTGRVEDEPRPGTLIGNYIIIEELARGGMGIVYRANQKQMNRLVALKVLPQAMLEDEELVLRFIREARAAAELNHPNVVRVFDIGRDHGFIWYSMELVPGQSLKALIREEGKLSPRKAVEVALGCARALEAAEAKGIVHRDVKPDNLLLAEDGTIKLADLGLVRYSLPDGADLTRAGDLLGTPSYMAPEQARDSRAADSRSDLWSLGATLYHALFGLPPFVAKTAIDTVSKLLKEEVRYPTEADTLARELRTTLRKLLAKAPEDRYQSATDVVKALERCRIEIDRRSSGPRAVEAGSDTRRLGSANRVHRGGSSPEHPVARARRRRVSRRGSLLPLGLVAAAAGLGGAFLLGSVHRAPERIADEKEPAATAARQPDPPPADVTPPQGEPAAVASQARTDDETPPATTPAPGPTPLPVDVARNAESLVEPTDEPEKAETPVESPAARKEKEEIELGQALVAALQPVRDKPDHDGLTRSKAACERTVAPLSSAVASELLDALRAAEKLLQLATSGLALDVKKEFTPRDGKTRSGAYTVADGVAKGSGDAFWFPAGCTTRTLCELAQRDTRSSGADVNATLGTAWAIVVASDLLDANARAKKGKQTRFASLRDCLARGEHRRYANLLATADAARAEQNRQLAGFLYHVLDKPDVSRFLEEAERKRVAEGIEALKATALTTVSKTWSFADGLPADWQEAEAVNPLAKGMLNLTLTPRKNGLELAGVGRIVAAAEWTEDQLQIDLDAVLGERGGVGITIGEHEDEGKTVWIVGGYGLSYVGSPNDLLSQGLGVLDQQRDGLWSCRDGFPTLDRVDPKTEKTATHPAGPVSLRLVAKRSEKKLLLTLSRVVDGKVEQVLTGTLSQHLPPPRSPLRAGVVATGQVVMTRFSVLAR